MFRRGLGAGIAAALALGDSACDRGRGRPLRRRRDGRRHGVASTPACPQANPCDTIAYALANSGTGDQILIDNGSYPESVTVGGGRSLAFQNFVAADGTGPATIDGGPGTAVTVPPAAPVTITRPPAPRRHQRVRLDGPAEVNDNVFDDPDATTAIGVQVELRAEGSRSTDNTIVDPAPGPGRFRVGV